MRRKTQKEQNERKNKKHTNWTQGWRQRISMSDSVEVSPGVHWPTRCLRLSSGGSYVCLLQGTSEGYCVLKGRRVSIGVSIEWSVLFFSLNFFFHFFHFFFCSVTFSCFLSLLLLLLPTINIITIIIINIPIFIVTIIISISNIIITIIIIFLIIIVIPWLTLDALFSAL